MKIGVFILIFTTMAFAAPSLAREITGSAYAINGNTISIKGQRIELHNIDAEQSDGKELQNIIRTRDVTCTDVGRSNNRQSCSIKRFGRPVNLEAELVKQGHAKNKPTRSGAISAPWR